MDETNTRQTDSTRKYDKFSGINNVASPMRMEPNIIDRGYISQLQAANNIDIDNDFRVSSRSGRKAVLSGTDIHSL